MIFGRWSVKIMIETVKQKILALDPANFQTLCDAYLKSKEEYKGMTMTSLGLSSSSMKTTKGTPDTYFVDNSDGKYIFAEYTTQTTELFKKIKRDISKCLNEQDTKIKCSQIKEIVYCHTSSNLTPAEDRELRNLVANRGIRFTIYGIDQMASDIFNIYPSLAFRYLDIPLDSRQIQTLENFIKEHDNNKLVAPLASKFLFREKEVATIKEAFDKYNVVLLTGAAGVGKTRLALYYAKNYIDAVDTKIYCIHSNNMQIYDDLNLYLNKQDKYFLILDDANQLTAVKNIVNYVNKPGYSVNILITVRNYAMQKVKSDINDIALAEDINIITFIIFLASVSISIYFILLLFFFILFT